MSSRPRLILPAVVCCGFACVNCFDGQLHAFKALGGASGSSSVGPGGATPAGGSPAGAGSSGTAVAGSGFVVIDDFADGDNEVEPGGWWYGENDGTGPSRMTFEPAAAGASGGVLRFASGRTSRWGAFLGLDLPGGVYDASEFAELVFVARADPPTPVSVRFLDTTTRHFVSEIVVTGEWEQFRLPVKEFSSLENGGDLFDPSRSSHLQFWVVGPSEASVVWLDYVGWERSPP